MISVEYPENMHTSAQLDTQRYIGIAKLLAQEARYP